MWNESFASAPPPTGMSSYVPGKPDPPSSAARDNGALKRKQRQLEKVAIGMDAINTALALLDELELKSL